ncbi:MAG: F0F1 ATP synthase subunit A [Deltaproteobacteria bacterium]|nr:F0F1 ATP synthase subunit A [Deltaproteobacteria bacterium]
MHDIILPTFGLATHTALMLYIIAGLTIFFAIMSARLRLVPGRAQSIIELFVDGFIQLVLETMGQKGRNYVPFVITFAVFIFAANVLSLIPGFIPPTANINTTVGLALIVFVTTHIVGIKAHGIKYLKQFVGPVLWLAPLMIPIEIVGHLARPVSLSMRLFGNMMGHEQIVMVLLLLMPIAYPLLAFSTVLGVLVVFIQSFIFTLLSMMYIGAALEEAH